MKWFRRGLAAAAVAVGVGVVGFAVVVVSGVAQAEEPNREQARQRWNELVARNLNISVTQLQNAETSARNTLIDEALAAGRITAQQAAQLKSQPGGGPFFGGGGPGGPGGPGRGVRADVMQAAATALNMTPDALRTELQSGKSLAQVAQARGVSRAALTTAIITAERAALTQAVQQGRLTQPQADQIAAGLAARVDQMIDRVGFGHRGGPGGPGGAPGTPGGSGTPSIPNPLPRAQ